MKRTFLRRKSKNPEKTSKDKADKALQDSYRKAYSNEKCEACGAPFNLMHHHVEKSNSMYLRWLQPINLIFVCSLCHNKIHFGDRNPVSAYSIKRGVEWLDKIKVLRQEPKPKGYCIKKYLEISEYYKTNVPDKY